MTNHSERRLGPVLLHALRLACEQRDLDVARGIEQVIRIVDQRARASGAERRREWHAEVAEARRALRALEGSIRRPGAARIGHGAAESRPVAQPAGI